MTDIQAQILELFQALPEREARALAEQLYDRTVRKSFYDHMTDEQRAELREGAEQADRGEGAELAVVLARIADRHGFRQD